MGLVKVRDELDSFSRHESSEVRTRVLRIIMPGSLGQTLVPRNVRIRVSISQGRD